MIIKSESKINLTKYLGNDGRLSGKERDEQTTTPKEADVRYGLLPRTLAVMEEREREQSPEKVRIRDSE